MSNGSSAKSNLLPLRHTDDPGPVVVSIPGVLGFGLSFAQLSATMPGQGWYSIDLGDLAGGRGTGLALPGLVADIAALVTEAAAGRPVRLVGHSLGGTLAYKLVPVLRALGQEVESLVLFDAVDPALITEEVAASREYRMWEYLTHIAMVFPEATARWADTLPTDGSVADDQVVARAEALLDDDVADLFTHGLVPAYHVYLRLADLRWPQAEPVSCPALLIQAIRSSTIADEQIDGWSRLLPGTLTVREIDATHKRMIEAENVRELASLMTEFFAGIEDSSQRKVS